MDTKYVLMGDGSKVMGGGGDRRREANLQTLIHQAVRSIVETSVDLEEHL